MVDVNVKHLQEPPLHMRGNIARVYLYMNAQYGLNLSYEEQVHYLKWHKQDKVDKKECSLYRQIVDLQGNINPWIESSCKAKE
jgi:deoxyribonuclease-1